ncbi:MAG: hypothetical protein GF329_21490 [Candidatus Lokiarchaeota archaeon]|nr:hypothetical protein [Candidatus Lokiarchaeota archaeon]
MAILGLLIQTKTGIPVYFSTWSDKIEKLKTIDTGLITGFFSAIFSFTDSFHKKLGYIRLLDSPMEIYGVDTVCLEVENYLFLCFVDSYQFHELVKYKLKWIYNIILKDLNTLNGAVYKLSPEQEVLIEDILRDHHLKHSILNVKGNLNVKIDELIIENSIFGISINSFDNSILYSNGIEYSSFELFLNNLGQKGSLIGDEEILYTYVSVPDFLPVLVVLINPVIKFPISDIIQEMAQGELPIYFCLIVDVNANVHEIVDKVLAKLNPLLI